MKLQTFHTPPLMARPGAFVLENVTGLLSFDGGRYLAGVLKRLSVDGCYAVRYAVYDAQDCGVPQSRRRVYIVGVACHLGGETLVLPSSKADTPALASFLGPRDAGDTPWRMPPESQQNARANLTREPT